MKYFGLKRGLLILFVILLVFESHAQLQLQLHKSRNENSWFVDANAGFNNYYGTLGIYNYDPILKLKKESHLALGINLGKSFNYVLSGRAFYNYAGLRAYNNELRLRFESKMHNVGGQFLINFSSWIGGISYVPDFTVYGIAGAGLVFASPNLYTIPDESTETSDDILIKSESVMAFELNAGIGLSYMIFHRFDAIMELAYHYSMSDELDLVSEGGKDKFLYLKAGLRYRFAFPGIKNTRAFGRKRK